MEAKVAIARFLFGGLVPLALSASVYASSPPIARDALAREESALQESIREQLRALKYPDTPGTLATPAPAEAQALYARFLGEFQGISRSAEIFLSHVPDASAGKSFLYEKISVLQNWAQLAAMLVEFRALARTGESASSQAPADRGLGCLVVLRKALAGVRILQNGTLARARRSDTEDELCFGSQAALGIEAALLQHLPPAERLFSAAQFILLQKLYTSLVEVRMLKADNTEKPTSFPWPARLRTQKDFLTNLERQIANADRALEASAFHANLVSSFPAADIPNDVKAMLAEKPPREPSAERKAEIVESWWAEAEKLGLGYFRTDLASRVYRMLFPQATGYEPAVLVFARDVREGEFAEFSRHLLVALERAEDDFLALTPEELDARLRQVIAAAKRVAIVDHLTSYQGMKKETLERIHEELVREEKRFGAGISASFLADWVAKAKAARKPLAELQAERRGRVLEALRAQARELTAKTQVDDEKEPFDFPTIAEMRAAEGSFPGASETFEEWRKSVAGAQNITGARLAYHRILIQVFSDRKYPEERIPFLAQRLDVLIAIGEDEVKKRRRRADDVRAKMNLRTAERQLGDLKNLRELGKRLFLFETAIGENSKARELGLRDRELTAYREARVRLILRNAPLLIGPKDQKLGAEFDLTERLRETEALLVKEAARIAAASDMKELELVATRSKVFRELIKEFPALVDEHRDWIPAALAPSLERLIGEDIFHKYVIVAGIPLLAAQGLHWLAPRVPRVLPKWAAYLGTGLGALSPYLKWYNLTALAGFAPYIGWEYVKMQRQTEAANLVRNYARAGLRKDATLFTLDDVASADREADAAREMFWFARKLDLALLAGFTAALGLRRWLTTKFTIRWDGRIIPRFWNREHFYSEHFGNIGIHEPRLYMWNSRTIEDAALIRIRDLRHEALTLAPPAGVLPAVRETELAARLARIEEITFEIERVLQSRNILLREGERVSRALERLNHVHRFDFERLGLPVGSWNPADIQAAIAERARQAAIGELSAAEWKRVQEIGRALELALRKLAPPNQPYTRSLVGETIARGGREMFPKPGANSGRIEPELYPIEYDVLPGAGVREDGGVAEILMPRRIWTLKADESRLSGPKTGKDIVPYGGAE